MYRLYHSKGDQELNNTIPISQKNILLDDEGLVYNFEVHSGVCLNQPDILF